MSGATVADYLEECEGEVSDPLPNAPTFAFIIFHPFVFGNALWTLAHFTLGVSWPWNL